MTKKIRTFMYLMTMLAVILMSAMPSYAVYAEGGEGDPPPEEAPVTEPAEPPAEEAAPVEEAPPSPAEEPVSVPEILEQVPEGTDLVVVNQEGSSEPLASEEAAEILTKGDPVWCPVGASPGDASCTPSYTGFDDLITELSGGTYSGDGVIWVESTYDANEDAAAIIFDGSSLTTLGGITVNGGWSGGTSTSLDPSAPSILDDPLTFTNWTGAVSIHNLTFQTANNVGGSLLVETDGEITLTNVSVDDNTLGSGAVLDNCLNSGAACAGSGDVTVQESSFSNNDESGLEIDTSGNMTVKDVTSTDNNDYGISMNTDYGVGNNAVVKNTTVTGNGNDGVHIYDVNGNVTLINLTVNDNNDGVEVDDTYGNVYGSNVNASGNGNDGIDINNVNGSLVLENSDSSGNSGNGFEISNIDGSLKLSCVTGSNNGEDGVYINSDGNATIRCSTFNDNADDGVDINLAATADLLSVTTTGNADLDVEVDTPPTTLTIKNIDCSKKEKPAKTEKGPWTKLYCLPGEIKVALYDTYGDTVEFENLCGYDAGVFDPNSWILPEEIPGGGEDYITSLQNEMLEMLPGLEPNDKYGLPGVIAQVLDELPFYLPDMYSYISAFFTVVVEQGELVDPLPEESSLTIRFRAPESLDDDEALTILWWNGADWIDLGGEYSEDGYYFQITTEEVGLFVLASVDVE